MKKVLGIVASPRRLGNCEIMAKEISRQIPESHELNLLRLSDFHIKPCRGCYLCLFKKQRCVLRDDLDAIIHAIVQADGLILAAPTYFLGANSTLKRLLDRGLAFYAHAEKIWGKPSVGVGIAGIDGKDGYTLLAVQSFLKLILSEIKYTTIVYGALPGEVFFNDQNPQVAGRLGKALFGQAQTRAAPACPVCGGDTFRFLDDGRVRCMLCSNAGTVDWESGTPVFLIERDEHGLFLSQQDALRHREWLRVQVKRFIEQKTLLKQITEPYRDGNWIKP